MQCLQRIPPCTRVVQQFKKVSSMSLGSARKQQSLTASNIATLDDNAEMKENKVHRYIDIGINLTDPVYRGIYNGTRRHQDDLKHVIARAHSAGVQRLLVTGSDLESSREAISLAKEFPGLVLTTFGIHPCSASSFTDVAKSSILASLHDLYTTTIRDLRSRPSPIAAYGEFGLDYDRLTHCSKDIQLLSFRAQLAFVLTLPDPLPLFLHSRAAHPDFVSSLRSESFLQRLLEKNGNGRLGVVHSFTGTVDEMKELVEMGFLVGINGCSLKTEENLKVVEQLPLDKLMLETDGPWCEIRPSHAGWKFVKEAADKGIENQGKGWKTTKKEKWVGGSLLKGRNEPCLIGRVAEVVAGVKGICLEEVTEAAWNNTVHLFDLGELE